VHESLLLARRARYQFSATIHKFAYFALSSETTSAAWDFRVDDSGPDFRIVALIIASALFMENLDATILTTAIPTMARDFAVPAPGMSVALTAYLLALALFGWPIGVIFAVLVLSATTQTFRALP
jgi:hypothetical protein